MNKGIALGEALLLFGLLLLAWVVYTQQEEIALLAEAVGKTGTTKATASVDGMPPPLPVERPGSVGATPPVEPEVPVNAPPPPPPPTPPTFEWPPGAVGTGPAS